MAAGGRAQTITRWAAITFMAVAVLTATAGGFAQSYAGLFHWALEHGLRGWNWTTRFTHEWTSSLGVYRLSGTVRPTTAYASR